MCLRIKMHLGSYLILTSNLTSMPDLGNFFLPDLHELDDWVHKTSLNNLWFGLILFLSSAH